MEDYKKKYLEALEKAKSYYNNEGSRVGMTPIDLEVIFPELADSEDEKIRNEIISYFNRRVAISEGAVSFKRWIAWLEKQGEHDNWAEELNNKIKELHKQCLAKIQEYNTPTIIWHSIDEKPKEMKELFCEWESDDATWHDVAFYDEESHTFRHAKMPINVTKWVYVDELLEKQGEQILANSAQNCKDEQKPADKVEPRFKVKYAGSEYNVFEVKDIAGVTFYGIEDEPNHIDYVRAENCERVDGYSIKENGSPFPIKPAKFSKENPAWSEGDSFRTGTLISVIKSGGSIRPELRDEFVNWLKSLRPQNHWKSSEEQIKVIESLRHKWLLGDSAEAKYKVEAFDELIEILKE